jgi:hypothetical protein
MKQEEWQRGPDSKLNTLQRILLHEEWLKEIHKEVKNKIESNKPIVTNTLIVGFPD